MDAISELAVRVDRLHKLLNEPQPGLSTWFMLIVREMDALVNYWQGNDKAEDPKG